MKLYIYSLQNTLYEGDAQTVQLPTVDGEISILSHHVPLVTALSKGNLRLKNDSEEKEIALLGGFAYTDGDRVVVLAD